MRNCQEDHGRVKELAWNQSLGPPGAFRLDLVRDPSNWIHRDPGFRRDPIGNPGKGLPWESNWEPRDIRRVIFKHFCSLLSVVPLFSFVFQLDFH